MEILPSYKFVSMDIVNLYTNIPVLETLTILKENLTRTGILNKKQIEELLSLLQIIVQQNYYTHDNKYFNQKEGLAMGSPLSGRLAEIYMNYYENKFLLSDYNRFHDKIVSYTRYVDDTFIVFNGTHTQVDMFFKFINDINRNIKFTMEMETNNSLNFLDVSVLKRNNHLGFKIYRKPTTTDIVINAKSNHLYTQKMAAFNALAYSCLLYTSRCV